MAKPVNVGDAVVFCDDRGVDHSALVTAVHGPGDADWVCINLLWVSGDGDRLDSYGRQVERASSIQRASVRCAHGNYWRLGDEPRVVYREPTV